MEVIGDVGGEELKAPAHAGERDATARRVTAL